MKPTRLFRVITRVLGGLSVVVAMYAFVLAYPEPFFTYAVTHSGFTFHSHAPLPAQTAAIAHEAARRLATSEINEASRMQRVFIVERPWLWSLLNGPYHRVMARNVELGNAILIPRLHAPTLSVCHFDGRCADFVHILTHEAVHTLVQDRIGVLSVWRLAWWQREGYPEYIASERCTHSEAPAPYQEAARIWKELLEQRRMNFDDVVRIRDLDALAPNLRLDSPTMKETLRCQ